MCRYLVLFISFLAIVNSQTTNVNRCVNHAGDLPINAFIEGCLTPPCQLPQLQDVVINLVFRAPRTMRTMRTLATAYLLIIPIPYDLGENAVTCNFLTNTYCPVLKDEVIQYTLRMYIESFFPVVGRLHTPSTTILSNFSFLTIFSFTVKGTSVTIEFRVVDDNLVPVMCLRVSVRIVAPLDSSNALRSNNATLIVDTAL